MNRLSRLTSILIHLQSKRIVAAQELAERFDVSKRTVYRDISTLLSAGVPIGFEQAKGYFIVDGYNLPPISISEEEAYALLTAEKMVEKQGDISLKKTYQSFVIKIKATLKSFQQEKVNFLENRIGPSTSTGIGSSSSLLEIQSAISNKTPLEIEYHSISKDEVSQRAIDPLAVYFTQNAWILIGYCHKRNGIREFRLDRMISFSESSAEIIYSGTFDLHKYFENISDPS